MANDIYRINPSKGAVAPVDLGDGFDILVVDGQDGLELDDYFAFNAEEIQGSNGGHDNLNLSNAATGVKLYGRKGNDLLIGGAFNDLLDGGSDNDTLIGNGGNDILTGREGVDRFFGGDGNDVIFVDAEDFSVPGIVADGGDGYDIMVFQSPTGAHLVLNQTFVNIEEIQGSDGGDDYIDVSSATGPMVIWGRGGNDYIISEGHNDIIRGGAGDDTIIGGLGADFLCGDEGDDKIYLQNNDAFVFGGAGNDTVIAKDGYNYTFIGYNYFQFENYYGVVGEDPSETSGKDHIDFSDAGADVKLTLVGRRGNDKLIGGAGKDYIMGGKGADFLSGNGGDDDIYGGDSELDAADGAVDTLLGGDGSDRLFIDAHDVVDGGAGYDYAIVHNSKPVHWVGYASRSIENFVGSQGDDYVDFSDALAGSYGVDRLGIERFGLFMEGRGGNDTLIAGAGNDTLLGSDGDDVLRGNAGNDQLWGNGGNDKYLFSVGDGQDVIKDASGAGDEVIFEGGSFNTSSVAFFRDGYNLIVGYGGDTITIENQFASNDFSDWSYGAKAIETFTLDALGLHITDINALVQQIHAYDTANVGVTFSSVNDVAANADVMSTIIAPTWA
ncbi:MAG TPA: calcium-binding protein [Oculatellaceae cyanobacterium]|jgi:Ca2+-binding RTX toxin-like protein